MSKQEPQWQTSVWYIIFHTEKSQILMFPGKNGYTLPHFVLPENGMWTGGHKIEKEALKITGSTVKILHRPYYAEDAATHEAEAFYVMEAIDQPSNLASISKGIWIGSVDLAKYPLAHPEHQHLIKQQLNEVDSGIIPEQRTPWARRGWYSEAVAWIQSKLIYIGYTNIDEITLVRTWGLSYVLRIPTDCGLLYFKASVAFPLFTNEASLLISLAERFPDHVPRPLAIDTERYWMLLADFGEPLWDRRPELRETILCTYGQMQLDAASWVDDLFAMGCVDRRLQRLEAQIEPLFNNPEATAQLEGHEVQQLQALVPCLKARCQQVARFKVPQTLSHGDFHTGNIAMRNETPLIFDWTDACVTHPFFDIFENIRQEEDIQKKNRWRDHYLAIWIDYEPMSRLQTLWALVEPLSWLHYAISYQAIADSVEPIERPDLMNAVTYRLRKVVETVG